MEIKDYLSMLSKDELISLLMQLSEKETIVKEYLNSKLPLTKSFENSNFEKSELNSKNQPIILNNNVENIKKDNVSTPLIIDNNNEKKLIPKTPIQDNKIYISSPIMKNKNQR